MLTGEWTVPELGPSLGRLTDPPTPSVRSPLGLTYDDLRLDLVSGIFDLAGAARGFAAAGDREGAMASLGRVAWIGLWERAVGAAAARIGQAANSRLHEVAIESRFPVRRLRTILLSASDIRAITARLGSGGAPFVAALDTLEQTARASSGGQLRAGSRIDDWKTALEGAARRLESAWLAVASAATSEEVHWRAEAERIRVWRRPVWPLWTLSFIVATAAGYVGLVLGGYLPVPPLLAGLAEFWWSRF